MPTLVAMADTHGFHHDLVVPEGDILIHAGDLTRVGTLEELAEANRFLGSLPHAHKIVVAGNHDWCFQKTPELARSVLDQAVYLQDELIEVEGLKIYGSPWQPEFLDWAFNLPRGLALAEKWALIPDDVDVLVTHAPPRGYGDRVGYELIGCENLLRRVLEIKPRLHIFGHAHEGRGRWTAGETTFANVATSGGEREAMVFQLAASAQGK